MQRSKWFVLAHGLSLPNGHGIYRIRMVDSAGVAVPLPRLVATDAEGLLYLGRSGVSTARSCRALAKRLEEFRTFGSHSASATYLQAKDVFVREGKYLGHQLSASVVQLPDDEIVMAEKRAVRDYFDAFGEVPPLNSAFPGKWLD